MGFNPFLKMSLGDKRYTRLPQNTVAGLQEETVPTSLPAKINSARSWTFTIAFALVCVGLGFFGGEYIQDRGLLAKLTFSPAVASSCSAPLYRREWRSFSSDEKTAYTDALHCMLSQKSRLKQGVSEGRYHDFVHMHVVHAEAGTLAVLRL